MLILNSCNNVDVLKCLDVFYLQKLVHRSTPPHYLSFLEKYLKNKIQTYRTATSTVHGYRTGQWEPR